MFWVLRIDLVGVFVYVMITHFRFLLQPLYCNCISFDFIFRGFSRMDVHAIWFISLILIHLNVKWEFRSGSDIQIMRPLLAYLLSPYQPIKAQYLCTFSASWKIKTLEEIGVVMNFDPTGPQGLWSHENTVFCFVITFFL